MAFMFACALVGLLGLTGATLADSASGEPAVFEPALAQPAVIVPALGQPAPPALAQPATVEPATAQPATAQPATAQPALAQLAVARPAWRASTATRHVPTRAESALTGAMHPATDRVMALLIGWVLLAVLGGGLLAPRR
ncbi:MAG: hypothetical protein ACR2G2_02140 [Pseudonocardia sp.]